MQGATTSTFSASISVYWFQSTPPMQGATLLSGSPRFLHISFNPRPLCRERRFRGRTVFDGKMFQSTPPMQGATTSFAGPAVKDGFQSTPPMQGATAIRQKKLLSLQVSIHAPYAGSDGQDLGEIILSDAVSIHAPYAGSDIIRFKISNR